MKSCGHSSVRVAIRFLSIALLLPFSAFSQSRTGPPSPGLPRVADATADQPPAERFWIAGRYDGNRVIVYFDAVKFEGTLAANSHRITPPIATGFFTPVGVTETYAAQFQKNQKAEHFSIGDKYDLLVEGGTQAVTLTAFVGAETDEEVGNDSFIGALGTLDKGDDPFPSLGQDHYVLRRHREPTNSGNLEQKLAAQGKYAYLERGTVQFDVQSKILELLMQRIKTSAADKERRATERGSPYLEVQAFHLSDGSLRYYASAEWYSGTQITDADSYSIAAWIAPGPPLHLLAIEPRTFGYSGDEPKLLAVVDLGGGKTGMVISISTGETIATDLFEYRDEVGLKHMRLLQSIAAGE